MFEVFSKLTRTFVFVRKANAKILAWFVYSGEKDKRNLLSRVQSTDERGESSVYWYTCYLVGRPMHCKRDTRVWPSEKYPMFKGNAHGV